ncbi:dicarboxylate/amino acid:cation symporter [Gallaecimonas xiamenensis]|uniref:Sodium:dicarboxylate symporter n=1 Tax=Gallaecimonas xiamenensis 3-C-1 TaxID=745411 RepID=K2K8U6_9GAMM|nr:dicarboxylate/amino acid:cation symporter [Gallaecimonas xiamenensis]EKE73680.1 sodium:dicarboxylate symporter [Gallaecimonas xiamenensis 3-C-1]
MNLVVRLLIGLAFGVLCGLLAPELLVRLLMTVKAIVGELIGFSVPLILLFYISSGIASLPAGSGRLLGRTLGLAYGSTLLAGTLAFLVARYVLPILVSPHQLAGDTGQQLTPFFTLAIPAPMAVMTALVLAFVLGLALAGRESALRQVLEDGKGVVEKLLANLIIPALPFYIAGEFAQMTFEGKVWSTLQTFGLVLVMAVMLHWLWLAVLYGATGAVRGRSGLLLLKTMVPAYVTAIGTMSSAATIPVALRQAKKNGVSEPVADFAMPLLANIHLSGSTITLVSCTTAVMLLNPELGIPDLGTMLGFILMLGVTMIAAPGAPGGAVMAALGLLSSMLGFSEANLALMIALYLAQDSFGTACNVTGDGALALLADSAQPKLATDR